MSKVVWQLVKQFVDTMITSNNRVSGDLWEKQNFIKHQQVSKYFGNYCLENFRFLFISLLIAKRVKKKLYLD